MYMGCKNITQVMWASVFDLHSAAQAGRVGRTHRLPLSLFNSIYFFINFLH